jgi:hypothetical protein
LARISPTAARRASPRSDLCFLRSNTVWGTVSAETSTVLASWRLRWKTALRRSNNRQVAASTSGRQPCSRPASPAIKNDGAARIAQRSIASPGMTATNSTRTSAAHPVSAMAEGSATWAGVRDGAGGSR